MRDARITIAGKPALNPRKAELKDGVLVLTFKPWSEDAKIMEAWFASARTPGDDYERKVLVEFDRHRRIRLLRAFPSACRTGEDEIGRERIVFEVHYSDLERIP